MEAVIFIGIQATGKTTFYKQQFFDTHVRISMDMLRTRHREQVLLHACIAAKQRFVVDNTNVMVSSRARYIGPARAAGFRVVGYYFRSFAQDALRRNAEREGRQVIPIKGVLGTLKRLEIPSMKEGFDELYHVSIGDAGEFVVREWNARAPGSAV